ncbi:SNF2-related protein [Photobacterium leiognathi]|uniref:SNF2-related protein n=1 Tax=Photobacterium leiognathi TaxID=553611 RepID=UPI003AF3C20F
MGFSDLKNDLAKVTTLAELLNVFDAHLSPVAKGVQEALEEQAINYGATKEYRVSIARARREANDKAIAIIDRVGRDASKLTPDDRAALAQYTGNGGIGGSIDEYYTPQWLAEGTWDQLKSYGFTGGNVLEPSAGTGVFLGTKPKNTIITATEISPISSAVNQLLHPTDLVENTPFERLAVRTEDDTFDAVVGNVPFGKVRPTFDLDPAYSHIRSLDEYFVERTIDKVKPGGLITLICPTRTVSGRSMRNLRERISRKAEFLGAHRIPSGTFGNSGSADVVTDVLVMRKFPLEFAQKLEETIVSDITLREAKVLWDTFIDGQWFNSVGKKYVHGDVVLTTDQYGKQIETVKIPGLTKGGSKKATSQRTQEVDNFNAGIKAKLAKPFKSRIDWELLEVSEPIQLQPVDGDSRFINGRQHTFENGVWVKTQLSASVDGTLDPAVYGATKESDISAIICSPQRILELDINQIKAIYNDMRDLIDDQTQTTMRLAFNSDLSDQEQLRIIRGCAIGRQIQNYQDAVSVAPYDAAAMLPNLQKLVGDEFDNYGPACNHKAFKKLSGAMSREFFMFANATTQDGTLSALMQGQIDRTRIKTFDAKDPNSIITHLFSEINLSPVTLDDFRSVCEDEYALQLNDKDLLEYLASYDNIAINTDGTLLPWSRATSGYVTDKINSLTRAIAYRDSKAVRDNMSRQIDSIKRKRKWTKTEDISFNMRAGWIPRSYVLEFLKENGFDELNYSKLIQLEDGTFTEETDYIGEDGIFTGYFSQNGKDLANNDERRFPRQLEKYLNGGPVQGGDLGATAIYRDQIKAFDEQFSAWMKARHDVDDITQLYNDSFNNFVEFQHSNSDLELEDVSGNVTLMGYQNEAIRRLSEDGRGILGFGTGLGKTLTALGLVQFNIENGRSRRTVIVVPKAVYENWFNECAKFYGPKRLNNIFFTALEPIKDGDDFVYEPVLDEDGKQVINKNTNEPETTLKVKWFDGDELTDRVNSIPHSAYNIVVVTKEVFAKIPLKPETLDSEAYDKLYQAIEAGKVSQDADTYKKQEKRLRLLAAAKDDGSAKASEYAYFEDMAFDNIIVDEGHMFRNSIKSSNAAGRLAYLSTSQEAQKAVDLRQKSTYLNKRYGRGTILLTATPTVNSPLDIYNMLSHILTEKEWLKMGVTDQDSFIELFGEKAEVQIQKLSGAIEEREGLVGFKNLSALRSLFYRFTNIQDATSVNSDVTIPDLIAQNTDVELSQEQLDLYEHLRFRAEVASLVRNDNLDSLSPLERAKADEIIARYPDDQTFAIIRDMDRVTNDLDLYHKRIRFIFPIADKEKVDKLAASLPATLKFSKTVKGEDGKNKKETWEIPSNIKASNKGNTYVLSVSQEYEDLVAASFKKFKINEDDVTHPTPPKTGAMLELLKQSVEAGGKCLIFTEEKATHRRLHRMVCKYLGLKKAQVGIINADTVDGKTSPINESVKEKKTVKLTDGEDLETFSDKGLEAIASQYNSGKMRVLICNKKCEVGVNLHKGTTDIFHLTLPWTPASIDQRNGRGARVGSTQSSVKTHFFNAKGSFDEFRLNTINRKRKWISELFTGTAEVARNEDIDDEAELAAMVASDPEARSRMLELIAAQEEKKRLEKKRKSALIDAGAFIKASRLSNLNLERLDNDLSEYVAKVEQFETQQAQAMTAIKAAKKAINDNTDPEQDALLQSRLSDIYREKRNTDSSLTFYRKRIKSTQETIDRASKAQNQIKRLKPMVQKAIDDGLLSDQESRVVNFPSEFLEFKGQLIKVGDHYVLDKHNSSSKGDARYVYRIDEILFESNSVKASRVDNNYVKDVRFDASDLSYPVSYTETDKEKMNQLDYIGLSQISSTLTESEFRSFIRAGLIKLSDTFALDNNPKNGLEFVNLDLKRIPAKYAETLVYPVPTDARLVRAVLDLGAKLHADSNIREYMHKPAFKAILGEQWLSVIENGDVNNASPDQIDALLRESFEKILIDDEVINERIRLVKGEGDTGYQNRLWSLLRPMIPTYFTNKNEIADVAEKIIADLVTKAEQEKDQERERQINANNASYTEHLNDPVSEIKARLSLFLEALNSMGKLRWANPLIRLRRLPEFNVYRDNMALFLADLTNANLKPVGLVSDQLQVDDVKLRRFVNDNAFELIKKSWVSEEDNALVTYLNIEHEQKDIQPPASVTVEASEIALPPIAEMLAKEGITMTKNNKPIVRKVGRKKVTNDSYSLFAFSCENPRKLSLRDSKFAAVGGFSGENLSDEFMGIWSFLPVTISDDELLRTVLESNKLNDIKSEMIIASKYREMWSSAFEAAERHLDRVRDLAAFDLVTELFINNSFLEAINTIDWSTRNDMRAKVRTIIRRTLPVVLEKRQLSDTTLDTLMDDIIAAIADAQTMVLA